MKKEMGPIWLLSGETVSLDASLGDRSPMSPMPAPACYARASSRCPYARTLSQGLLLGALTRSSCSSCCIYRRTWPTLACLLFSFLPHPTTATHPVTFFLSSSVNYLFTIFFTLFCASAYSIIKAGPLLDICIYIHFFFFFTNSRLNFFEKIKPTT